MKNFPKFSIVVVIIVLLCILALCGYLWHASHTVGSYKGFREAELKAIPEFDRLNEQVEESLPPLPAGVSLVKKQSVGIDTPTYLHGRKLHLEYKQTPPTDPNEVLEYYREYLLEHGWLEAVHNVSSNLHRGNFYHDTSCIEVLVWDQYLAGEYEITIWHDFWKQSFSPTYPGEFFVNLLALNSGQVDIAECP